MKKAFLEGFKTGFIKASIIGIPIVLVFVLGLYLGSASHPYEVCKSKYTSAEDIIECIWILENEY